MRAGLSLNADAVYLSGNETLKDSGRKTQMNEAGLFHYGSIFGEVATDAGFALGVEYAPEYADLPRETRKNCLTTAAATNDATGVCQVSGRAVVTNTVDAKVSDAATVYVHVPVGYNLN
jgi:hypothetical protein